jgi:hypothetical protein
MTLSLWGTGATAAVYATFAPSPIRVTTSFIV